MPKFYDSISDDLRDWAMAQQVFFTASAPLSGRHVNISPKGLPSSTFSILSPKTAAYIDATGSGSETIAHVYENGRVTIMFCSFGPSPRIMRFFCTGKVIEWDQKGFDGLVEKLLEGREIEKPMGARAVIWLEVFKVQTSCGFGVPFLGISPPSPPTPPRSSTPSPSPEPATDHAPSAPTPILIDRDTLGHWARKRVASNKMDEYRAKSNSYSLDGCPGLRAALRTKGDRVWASMVKARARRIVVGQWEGMLIGMVLGVILMGLLNMSRVHLGGLILL